MSVANNNFGLITKLKSFVKKTGRVIFRTNEDKGITEALARKIQKTSYDSHHLKRKDIYTAPYKIIAEQLQVADNTIYKAAVFRLSAIALNEDKLATPILKILEEQAVQKTKDNDLSSYILSHITKIQQMRKSK